MGQGAIDAVSGDESGREGNAKEAKNSHKHPKQSSIRYGFYNWLANQLRDPARAKGLLIWLGVALILLYVAAHLIWNPNQLDNPVRALSEPSETVLEFLESGASGGIQLSRGEYLVAIVDKNRLKRYFNEDQVELVEILIQQHLDRQREAAYAVREEAFAAISNYARAVMPASEARTKYMALGMPSGLSSFQSTETAGAGGLDAQTRQIASQRLAVERQSLSVLVNWFASTICRKEQWEKQQGYSGAQSTDIPCGKGNVTVESLSKDLATFLSTRPVWVSERVKWYKFSDPRWGKPPVINCKMRDGATCLTKLQEQFQQYPSDLLVQVYQRLVEVAQYEEAVWHGALERTANLYSDVSFQWVWVERHTWVFELVFWSLIGVIVQAISTVSAASRPSSVAPGFTAYDPGELMQTFSRFFTAPIIAIVVTGMVASGLTGLEISLANAPFFLTFAFISGFASERFVALIKVAIKKILPRLEVQEEKLENLSRFMRPERDEAPQAQTVKDLEKKVIEYAKTVASNDIVARGSGLTRETE